MDELWSQQYGAARHTPDETINVLRETFGKRIITRRGPVGWSSKSCDLKPLEYVFCVVTFSRLFRYDEGKGIFGALLQTFSPITAKSGRKLGFPAGISSLPDIIFKTL